MTLEVVEVIQTRADQAASFIRITSRNPHDHAPAWLLAFWKEIDDKRVEKRPIHCRPVGVPE